MKDIRVLHLATHISCLNKKIMKLRLIFVLSAVLFLMSCHNVYYKVPPPGEAEALEAVPEDFKGTFVLEAFEGQDTIVISEAGFVYDGERILNENAVLKPFDGRYFISMKDDSTGLWGAYLLEPVNKMEIKMYDLDAQEKGDLDAMQALTPVDTVMKEDGSIDYVIIDPRLSTLEEFLQLGLYKQMGLLRKIPTN